MNVLAAEQRRLTRAVASASDQALASIVAYFDSMTDRREADRLLDAARPRLRRLRPPRPITLPRLLFLPLDGVIVDPRVWRRDDGTIPRNALVAMTAVLRQALGAEGAAIEAGIAGRHFGDLPVVDGTGRKLWHRAAKIMPDLPRPAEWEETGLTQPDFHQIAALAAGVWRHAEPLWSALIAARDGPPEAMVRDALTAAATEDAKVGEAMLATILLKASKPGSVAAEAARLGPPGAAERMLDRWLEHCAPDVVASDPAGAARLAEAFAEAVADLEASPALRRPERRQRVAALRRDVAETCRSSYADAAQQSLLDPLAEKPTPDDTTMQALEGTARALRRLEVAGRSLGAGTAFDATLRRILDGFGVLRAGPAANPADLARLAEILAGPEAALRLLDQGRP